MRRRIVVLSLTLCVVAGLLFMVTLLSETAFADRQCATDSIGVTEPERVWYLAEGATDGGFETWVLVQNPGSEAARVTLSYQTDQGEKAGPAFDLPPKSRESVNVADTVQTYKVSTVVSSNKPVVAERAVYWGPGQQPPPPGNMREAIVFVRDKNVWMVYLYDGSEVQLTNSSESKSSPQLSPDGRYVVFASSGSQSYIDRESAVIKRVCLDGMTGPNNKLQTITKGFSPAYLPDGGLVFARYSESADRYFPGDDLYTISSDGSKETRIADFSKEMDMGGGVAIMSINCDSASGKIVFVRGRRSDGRHPVLINADGSGMVDLDGRLAGSAVLIAPDQLLYSSGEIVDRSHQTNIKICYYNCSTGEYAQLTSGPNDDNPTVSPSKTRMAFQRGEEIYTASIRGESLVALTSGSMPFWGMASKPLPPSSQWRSAFYFAEGYTGANFQEYACLENPNASEADAWITCMFSDGSTMSQYYSLKPSSRLTVDINQLAGAGKEVSLRIVSTSAGIVAERPMYFNYNGTWTGGSDAIGATSPSSNWYFAEGNTLSNFDQYVTVLNPGSTTAKLTFHYMVEGKGEKVTTGSVPAHSRATFKTRDQIGNNLNASLYLSSSQSVVAERPMYFDYNTWTGGHDVVGANSPANAWYFAEGTTRSNFNEWLCLQNPGKSKITVKARYQLGSGQGTPISKTYTVPAKQRLTVLVNSEIGANKDNSVQLTSDSLFIAERPMYFNYYGNWTGGHDVLGANSPATTWSFAEGTTRDNFNEWLCLQNPGGNDAHATITYYTTSGQAIKKTKTVKANSRLTVNVNESAGANLDISAKVTSDIPIIVERPMYFNYNGWTGGHDVVGLTQ